MPDGGPNTLGQGVIDAIKSLVSSDASTLAKVVGVWTAARAAVSTVASGIAAAATQATINQAQATYQGTPISPAALADMVVRNVLTGPGVPPTNARVPSVEGNTATQEAALSGLSPSRFEALVLDNGESYGILDALRMYNRGTLMPSLVPGPAYETGTPLYEAGPNLAAEYGISYDELLKVIHYSRVRDEFVPDFLKLAKSTLSPADAVELAVKEIVPTDVARSLFEAAGGVGEQFQALVDASGDSVGIEKAADMLAHGLIDEGQMLQIIGLSRANPRFYKYYLPDPQTGIPPVVRKWLPIYELRLALETGIIDQATALEWMKQEGYDPQQSQLFLAASAIGTIQNPKTDSMAIILSEYQSNMLTEAQATEALTKLGYVPEAIPFLLQYAQSKAVIAARNTAITRVRAAYLLGLLTNDQATGDLSQLGVPAAAVRTLLTDWEVERSVPHTLLTTAQIGKLVKGGEMDTATATRYWGMRGYTSEDIAWLFQIYPPPPSPTAPPPGSPGTPAATSG